jgi:hypothetical protein
MSRLRRLLVPTLLAVLLAATSLAVTGATPVGGRSASSCTWMLTVPASAFRAETEGYHYYNSGWMLRSEDTVQRYFNAYVPLPYGREMTLNDVEVIGKDNTASYELCVEVLRFDPDTPGRHSLGKVCSGGSYASSTDPNSWTVPLTSPATIGLDDALYLWLMLDGNVMMELHLYGVKITYECCDCWFFPLGIKE